MQCCVISLESDGVQCSLDSPIMMLHEDCCWYEHLQDSLSTQSKRFTQRFRESNFW